MRDEISSAVLAIWKETEPSLRKDKIGRELFKELLKRVYRRLKGE